MKRILFGLGSVMVAGALLAADTSTGGSLSFKTYLSEVNNLKMVGSDGSIIKTPNWYLTLLSPVGGVLTQVRGRKVGVPGTDEPVVASFNGTSGFVSAGGDWELSGFAQGGTYEFSVAAYLDPTGQGFALSTTRTVCSAGQVTLGGNGLTPPQPAGTFAFGGAQVCVVTVPKPPTAAGLAFFRSARKADGSVEVSWRSLVEVQVLGFRVERSLPRSGWERVGEGVVPAAGQTVPHSYGLDLDQAGGEGTRYRLIELDFQGQERVVAEAAETLGLEVRLARGVSGLTLRLGGQPSARTAVEVATQIEGPWTQVASVALDDQGEGLLDIEWDRSVPTQFFRVIAE